MKHWIVAAVALLAPIGQTALAALNLDISAEEFNALVRITIAAIDTADNEGARAACVTKFNELTQKLEVTNRIIVESVPCHEEIYDHGNSDVRHVHVASITILK